MINIEKIETLKDQSNEILHYFLGLITPKITNEELQNIFYDFKEGPSKKKSDNFVVLNKNSKISDFLNLKNEELKLLYQIFVSRENNTRKALKWRLNQYLKYTRSVETKVVKIAIGEQKDQIIDFILETEKKKTILIACFDLLERTSFEMAKTKIIEFSNSNKLIPNRIIFCAYRSYRNVPISEEIALDGNLIRPELWLEYIDENCLFNATDLLMSDSIEIDLACFNFTNMEDLLDFIYSNSDGGQISLFRKPYFFSNSKGGETELLWKGIMIKTLK